VHLAGGEVNGPVERAVAEAALRLADWLRALFDARPTARATLLGPAPCPIGRVRGRWRWHLLLKSPDPARLTRLLRYTAARAPVRRGVRLTLDRDPVSLL
jgi:primosomal protein N' (replication factor Y)